MLRCGGKGGAPPVESAAVVEEVNPCLQFKRFFYDLKDNQTGGGSDPGKCSSNRDCPRLSQSKSDFDAASKPDYIQDHDID